MTVTRERRPQLLVCALLASLLPACGGSSQTSSALSLPIVSSWTRVDGGAAAGIGFSGSFDANSASGAVAYGKVYLTWIEKNASGVYQIRARVYNGNDASPSFASVDGGDPDTGLNIDPSQSAVTMPRLAALDNKLYLAWHEPTALGSQVHVSVYNGNDASPAWTYVDDSSGGTGSINFNPSRQAFSPVLAVNAGKLYAIWYELGQGGVYQVRVSVYGGNDAAPAWHSVDGGTVKGLNLNPADTVGNPTLISAAGKLYAAWSEAASDTLHVKVYNGNDSSPSWTFVDGNTSVGLNHVSTSKASVPALAVLGSKLYAIWTEFATGGTTQIRAASYNGNDAAPAWAFVDGNGANGLNAKPQNNANNPTLAVYGGVLYAAWKEQLGSPGDYGIRVAYYNGSEDAPVWVAVDKGTLSYSQSDNSEFPALIPAADRLYCVWDEETVPGRGQIRVSSGN